MSERMNIKDRMKTIFGIKDVSWNGNNLSLAIYYDPRIISLDKIKSQVMEQIDHAHLQVAIEKINFYTMTEEEKDEEAKERYLSQKRR